MLLAEMSWDEVEAYLEKDDRVVVALGSTEQHGRRGPLGTDHLIPQGLAVALAEKTGTIVAPPLVFGVAEHHMAYPGTVAIRPSSYMAFVEDVFTSLHRHGFKRIFVLNGHGGNRAPLECVILELANRFLDLKFQRHAWWTLPGVEAMEGELFGSEGICHASPGEISLAWACLPSAEKDKPVPPGVKDAPGDTFMNRVEQRERFPDGVLGAGNQNLADLGKGRKMFKAILGMLEARYAAF